MTVSEHKEIAKKTLKGKWSVAIGAFFIYSVISGLTGMIPQDYAWLSPIIFILLTAPLAVGYAWFYLELKRTPNPKIETLFDCFSKNYVRNALTSVLVTVFTALWTLLLIVPGIIKALAYSMTYYILKDHPEMTSLEAITASRKMMDGKKKDLFFLILSFIVWFLIPIALFIVGGVLFVMAFMGDGSFALLTSSIIACTIAFISTFAISIYVTPYYMTSLAVFYDDYAKLQPVESDVQQHVTEIGE